MMEHERTDKERKIKNSLFAERFDRMMTVRDIRNKDLAEAIFVAPSTVSGWRIGRRQPDLYELSLISRTLGVSSDYLLGINNDDSFPLTEITLPQKKDVY